MRNSEKDCSGRCGMHGAWEMRVEFIGCEDLRDECPACLMIGDTARNEGYDEGHKIGFEVGQIKGRQELRDEILKVLES